MKDLKRKIGIVLAVLLVIAGLSMTSWASDATSGTCGENVTWEFNDGTLTISGTGAMTDYKEGAFEDVPWYSVRSQITTIVIEEGVTEIGGLAFSNCTAVTSVSIPDTVTTIGETAFSYCTSLESISLPDSVDTILSFAFADCSVMTDVRLSAKLNTMGVYVFAGCDELTTVEIPEGATIIWDNAFASCKKLTGVILPESMKVLGEGAFTGCDGLTTIAIPKNVKTIGEQAFQGCDNLDGIWVDENNQYYSSDASGVLFDKEKTTLIQAVTKLSGDYVVPDTVTTIEKTAFWCPELTGISLPEGLTTIGDGAFGMCSELTELKLPSTLTTIGKSAFSGLEKVTEWKLPDGLKVIGDQAFGVCLGMTEIVIPASVTSIGMEAFYATGLKTIKIPAGVTEIGDGAFSACSALDGIWVDEANANYSSDENGVLFNKAKTELIMAPMTLDGSYVVPETVKVICDDAFDDCSIGEVTLPSGLISIGKRAFSGLNELETITIPASVTSIGEHAFFGNLQMTEIRFKGNAPEINERGLVDLTATAYYPQDSDTWNEETLLNYGGTITWVSYDPNSLLEMTAVLGVADLAGFPYTGGYGANSNVQIQVTENGTYTLTYNGSIGSETSLGYLMVDLIGAETLLDEYYLGLELKDLTLKADGVEIAVDFDAILTGDLEDNGNWRIEVVNMERGLDGSEAEDAVTDRINFNETLELTFTIAPIKQCGDDAWWDLKEGVLTIYGTGAMDDFESCPWAVYNDRITEIVVEDGITSVGASAFNGLTSLTKVTLGKDVVTIGSAAFINDASLSEVNLNGGLQTIGEFAFGSCGFTEITIPGTVSDMTASVFQDCAALKKVVFEDGATSVGGQTFDGCTALESVTIPGTVKTITTSLFNNCTNLTAVILGEGIEEISYSAFDGCTELKEIKLPKSLKTINHGAFMGAGLVTLVIPEGVTTVGMNCFDSCTSLVEVTLPATLTSLNIAAFYNCTSLETINFAEGLTEIKTGAFRNCSSLKTVKLPESLITVWGDVFRNCTGLTSIVIPKNVQNMYWSVFNGCTSLTEIFFKGEAPNNVYVEEDGTSTVYPSLEDLTATVYYSGNSWTEEQRASYVDDTAGSGIITWVDMYAILDGEDETFDVSTEEGVAVRVDGEMEEFTDVYVDGKLVDPSNYTVTRGSVIITFKEEFLRTLDYGEHTVTFYFKSDVENNVVSGAAVSSLTVMCGHTNMTEAQAIAPDCESNGNNQYYTCGCGKVFKADGVTETTIEAEVIPALDHQMDTEWTMVDEVHYHACMRKDCDHVEDSASCSGGEATCQEKAICTVCGEAYGKLGEHIPGPEASEDAAQTCTVCGEELAPKLEHVHVDADEDGKCDGCGYAEETTAEETTEEKTTPEETTAEETTEEENTTEKTTEEEMTAEDTTEEETTAEETTAEETTAEKTTGEETTAEETTEEDTTETPDTGDSGSMVFWSAVIVSSLVIAGTMTVFEKKRKTA